MMVTAFLSYLFGHCILAVGNIPDMLLFMRAKILVSRVGGNWYYTKGAKLAGWKSRQLEGIDWEVLTTL